MGATQTAVKMNQDEKTWAKDYEDRARARFEQRLAADKMRKIHQRRLDAQLDKQLADKIAEVETLQAEIAQRRDRVKLLKSEIREGRQNARRQWRDHLKKVNQAKAE